MEQFTTHTGVGVPLRRSNVDTDQIIPAVYLKRVTRTGFEDALFAAWRGDPNFVLNQPAYAQGSVLVAGPDFGTGSSTFERLRDISFDRIKIDQSFVKNITESKGDAEIVRAMISMAHAKGLKTTAEGVETAEQREVLRSFGCDEIQGFLISRPVEASAFAELLRAQIDNPLD